MLQNFSITSKDGFSIWFDKRYKKEYYITQLEICKTKFVFDKGNKFNSIKLIENFSNEFNEEKNIYYSSSNMISPFEENYGMFLINFLNADFSTFESSYLTFFCFYGFQLLNEFKSDIPSAHSFNNEQEFKCAYEDIFYNCKKKLKDFQNVIRLCVNYSYNLKRNNHYKNSTYLEKFISYSISKNLFKYTTNMNVYFNINYAYKINDITSTKITPLIVKEKINDRVINTSESNIYNSNYISNLVYLSLYEIASNSNVCIGICKNCGKYFVSYRKTSDKYCRITYSENEIMCKDIGIQATYKRKQKNNPCLELYRKTYQKKLMYAKRSEDSIVKQQFEDWKISAKKKVKEFNYGTIKDFELIKWLNDS